MSDATRHVQGTDPAHDPRDRITPYAFELDEALLGIELASPSRRLVALLIDLLLAAIIANAAGLLVGIVVAFLFFRLATRKRIDRPLKRWARATLAFFGAVILFGTVLALVEGDDDGGGPFYSEPSPAVPDSVQQARMNEVRAELQANGVDPEALAQLPFMPAEVRQLMTAPPPTDTMQTDTRADAVALVNRYAQAIAESDTTVRDSLRPAMTEFVAGPQIEALEQQLEHADDRIDDLEDRNDALSERVQNPSIWSYIKATARDFGLSIGWIGVYFTIFLTWWSGQTPGKWLFGLRVVRLDGEPMTLWNSFNRFAGYAAGVATGLLGFAQVYWDPNRQGIHDRIAYTVVVRTRDEATT
jgi:uncharacterized RDD family membrane protein YckC